MRSFNILVFDDFIAGPTLTADTRADFNDKLGSVDKLALFAVTDQVSGADGTLTVQIFHSADGINWVAKNTTPEINVQAVPETTTTVDYGSDAGTAPSLGLVRLKLTLATADQAHVKLWVTGRDES